MVSKAPADSALLAQAQETDESWQPVTGAPGLLRIEIPKPDGRRLTVYRRRGTDSP